MEQSMLFSSPLLLINPPMLRFSRTHFHIDYHHHHHSLVGLRSCPTINHAFIFPPKNSQAFPPGDLDGDDDPSPLPPPLRYESLPRHVAVIMDGNSRWARGRGLPPSAGHKAGYTSLMKILDLSCKWGIRALTVFAFSSENWLRPKSEVDLLMMVFQDGLKESMAYFMREGIRVCIIGDSYKLPKPLQKMTTEVEEITRNNSRLDLIVAIRYSGRNDIVQACQKIAMKVKHGMLEPSDITESLLAQELETNCINDFPYPDLLIRTSGELRLSNFLLWESAYTEFYFAKMHWPDFSEAEYIAALNSFQKRNRHFGLGVV